MSLTTIGIIGIILLIILLFSKMPVGFVMGFLGFLGFSYVRGLNPGLSLLARDAFEIFSSYGLTVSAEGFMIVPMSCCGIVEGVLPWRRWVHVPGFRPYPDRPMPQQPQWPP